MTPRCALVLALAACDGRDLLVAPTPELQRMLRQPKVDAYEGWPEGGAMRLPPEGTVPFDAHEPAPLPPWDAPLLARGRDRYAVACRPCHGPDGLAATPVARSMELRPPASLHEPRVVALSDDRILGIVLHGYGLMPAYGGLLSRRDAWAVVAWVRALQVAGAAPLDALPPDARALAERELR